MAKRPSFPVDRLTDEPARLSLNHRLIAVAFFLAIFVAGGLLAKAVGPIAQTPSDPETYLTGP